MTWSLFFPRAEKWLHAIYNSGYVADRLAHQKFHVPYSCFAVPRRIIAPGLSQKNFDDYDMQFTKKVISELVSPAEWDLVVFTLAPLGHVHFIELVMPALVAGAKKSSRSRKPGGSGTPAES